MDKKLFIIGLDGATFDLMLPWIDEGRLPNLASIISEGTRSHLKSTIPYNSAVAWSSFMTGKNPGNHGIFDFYYRTSENYDINFVNFGSIGAKTFWDVIGGYDGKVGIVNVPVTYPAPKVNGYLVSGLMAPEVNEKIFYPRQLHKELLNAIGDYDVRVYAKDFMRFQKWDQLFKKLMELVDKRFAIFKYLMETKPWDFLCYVFSATDFVQHFFWMHFDKEHPLHNEELSEEFGDCILKVYQKIDHLVGELTNSLPPETSLIIMSDHGAGPNSNRAVFLNNWLEQEGFLAFADGQRKRRFGFKDSLRKGIALGRKYIPRKYKDKVKQFSSIKSKSHSLFRFSGIDWKCTKAFSDDNRGSIWINLKGRNAHGIVEPGREYESIRDRIVGKAKRLVDPQTGETVFQSVLKGQEVYYGRYAKEAPDVLLLQADKEYTLLYRLSNANRESGTFKTFSFKDLTEIQPAANASHRRNGILIMKGPRIKRGHQLTGADIIDIAPTALYLLGIPIPKDMDGKLLNDAIDNSHLSKHPPTFSEMEGDSVEDEAGITLSANEAEQVRKNLQGLGYLE